MRAQRLRPAHTPERLAEIYATPHDHRIYGRGHAERVEATIGLVGMMIPRAARYIVGDLSCGNGEIARAIRAHPSTWLHLGDIAPGYDYEGPLELTLAGMPDVGTYVCSETIEHLDDPGKVLVLIRSKAEWLVLSTPLDCWDDTNTEHYWAWDREHVEDMLERAGWSSTLAFDSVDSREYGEPYLYGIWVVS